MKKKLDVKSAAAVMGSKGGRKTAENMTPTERSERGKKAIQARWDKKRAEEVNK